MKKYIIGLISGIILTSVVVYAADVLISAGEINLASIHTTKTNVADAIDELFTNAETLNLGTATANDILSGKKAAVGNQLLTGTMPNKGAWNTSVTDNGKVTIPEGYHNGGGFVDVNVSDGESTLVWENSSPTSSFSAQTITFTNPKAETTNAFYIIYYTGRGSTYAHAIINVQNYSGINDTSDLPYLGWFYAGWSQLRKITSVTTTSITFDSGLENGAGAYNTGNGNIIPTKIYALSI